MNIQLVDDNDIYRMTRQKLTPDLSAYLTIVFYKTQKPSYLRGNYLQGIISSTHFTKAKWTFQRTDAPWIMKAITGVTSGSSAYLYNIKYQDEIVSNIGILNFFVSYTGVKVWFSDDEAFNLNNGKVALKNLLFLPRVSFPPGQVQIQFVTGVMNFVRGKGNCYTNMRQEWQSQKKMNVNGFKYFSFGNEKIKLLQYNSSLSSNKRIQSMTDEQLEIATNIKKQQRLATKRLTLDSQHMASFQKLVQQVKKSSTAVAISGMDKDHPVQQLFRRIAPFASYFSAFYTAVTSKIAFIKRTQPSYRDKAVGYQVDLILYSKSIRAFTYYTYSMIKDVTKPNIQNLITNMNYLIGATSKIYTTLADPTLQVNLLMVQKSSKVIDALKVLYKLLDTENSINHWDRDGYNWGQQKVDVYQTEQFKKQSQQILRQAERISKMLEVQAVVVKKKTNAFTLRQLGSKAQKKEGVRQVIVTKKQLALGHNNFVSSLQKNTQSAALVLIQDKTYKLEKMCQLIKTHVKKVKSGKIGRATLSFSVINLNCSLILSVSRQVLTQIAFFKTENTNSGIEILEQKVRYSCSSALRICLESNIISFPGFQRNQMHVDLIKQMSFDDQKQVSVDFALVQVILTSNLSEKEKLQCLTLFQVKDNPVEAVMQRVGKRTGVIDQQLTKIVDMAKKTKQVSDNVTKVYGVNQQRQVALQKALSQKRKELNKVTNGKGSEFQKNIKKYMQDLLPKIDDKMLVAAYSLMANRHKQIIGLPKTQYIVSCKQSGLGFGDIKKIEQMSEVQGAKQLQRYFHQNNFFTFVQINVGQHSEVINELILSQHKETLEQQNKIVDLLQKIRDDQTEMRNQVRQINKNTRQISDIMTSKLQAITRQIQNLKQYPLSAAYSKAKKKMQIFTQSSNMIQVQLSKEGVIPTVKIEEIMQKINIIVNENKQNNVDTVNILRDIGTKVEAGQLSANAGLQQLANALKLSFQQVIQLMMTGFTSVGQQVVSVKQLLQANHNNILKTVQGYGTMYQSQSSQTKLAIWKVLQGISAIMSELKVKSKHNNMKYGDMVDECDEILNTIGNIDPYFNKMTQNMKSIVSQQGQAIYQAMVESKNQTLSCLSFLNDQAEHIRGVISHNHFQIQNNLNFLREQNQLLIKEMKEQRDENKNRFSRIEKRNAEMVQLQKKIGLDQKATKQQIKLSQKQVSKKIQKFNEQINAVHAQNKKQVERTAIWRTKMISLLTIIFPTQDLTALSDIELFSKLSQALKKVKKGSDSKKDIRSIMVSLGIKPDEVPQTDVDVVIQQAINALKGSLKEKQYKTQFVSDHRTKLQQDYKKLQTQLKQLRQVVSTKQKDLQDNLTKIIKLTGQVQKFKALQNLQKQIVISTSQAVQSGQQFYKRKLKQLQAEKDATRERIQKDVELRYGIIKQTHADDIERYKSRIKQIQTDLDYYKDNLWRAKQEAVQKVQKTLKARRLQLQSQFKTQIAKIKKQYLESKLSYQQRGNQQSIRIKKLQSQYAKKHQQTKIQYSRKVMDTQRLIRQGFQNTIREKQATIKAKVAQLQKAQTRYDDLQVSMNRTIANRVNAQRIHLEERLVDKDAQINDRKKQIEGLLANVRQLENQMNQKAHSITKLEYEKQISALTSEVNRLNYIIEAKVNEEKNRIDQTSNEIKNLTKELATKETNLQLAKQRLTNNDATIDRLTKQNAQQQQKIILTQQKYKQIQAETITKINAQYNKGVDAQRSRSQIAIESGLTHLKNEQAQKRRITQLLDKAQNRKKQLQNQVQALQQQKAAALRKATNLEADMGLNKTKYQNQIKFLKEKQDSLLKQINKQKNKAKQQIAQNIKTMSELKVTIMMNQEAIKQLGQSNDNEKRRVKQLQGINEQMKKDADQLKKKNDKEIKRLVQLEKKSAQNSISIQKAMGRVKQKQLQVEAELSEATAKNNKQKENIRKEYQQKIEQVQKKKKKQIQKFQKEINDLIDKYDGQIKGIKIKHTQQISKVQSDLVQTSKKLKQEIKDLQGQIDQRQVLINQYTDKLSKTQILLEQYNEIMEYAGKYMTANEANFNEQIKMKLVKMKNKTFGKLVLIIELKEQSLKNLKIKNADLQAILDDTKAEYAKICQISNGLSQQILAQQQLINKKDQQITSIKAEIASNKTLIQKIKKQLNQKQNLVQSLRLQLTKANQSLKNMQTYKQKLAQAEVEIQNLKAGQNLIKDALRQSEQNLKQLAQNNEANLKMLKQTLQSMTDQNLANQQIKAQLQTRIDRLTEDALAYTTQLASLQQSNLELLQKYDYNMNRNKNLLKILSIYRRIQGGFASVAKQFVSAIEQQSAQLQKIRKSEKYDGASQTLITEYQKSIQMLSKFLQHAASIENMRSQENGQKSLDPTQLSQDISKSFQQQSFQRNFLEGYQYVAPQKIVNQEANREKSFKQQEQFVARMSGSQLGTQTEVRGFIVSLVESVLVASIQIFKMIKYLRDAINVISKGSYTYQVQIIYFRQVLIIYGQAQEAFMAIQKKLIEPFRKAANIILPKLTNDKIRIRMDEISGYNAIVDSHSNLYKIKQRQLYQLAPIEEKPRVFPNPRQLLRQALPLKYQEIVNKQQSKKIFGNISKVSNPRQVSQSKLQPFSKKPQTIVQRKPLHYSVSHSQSSIKNPANVVRNNQKLAKQVSLEDMLNISQIVDQPKIDSSELSYNIQQSVYQSRSNPSAKSIPPATQQALQIAKQNRHGFLRNLNISHSSYDAKSVVNNNISMSKSNRIQDISRSQQIQESFQSIKTNRLQDSINQSLQESFKSFPSYNE